MEEAKNALQVSLSDNLLKQLKEYADFSGLPIGHVAELAIAEYLSRHPSRSDNLVFNCKVEICSEPSRMRVGSTIENDHILTLYCCDKTDCPFRNKNMIRK